MKNVYRLLLSTLFLCTLSIKAGLFTESTKAQQAQPKKSLRTEPKEQTAPSTTTPKRGRTLLMGRQDYHPHAYQQASAGTIPDQKAKEFEETHKRKVSIF